MNPAEEYILRQPEPYKSMVLQLQVVIENVLPEVELLYKYKIPFYYIGGKPFCYLNVTKGYVDVGFWSSAHLTKHQEHMYTKGRKVMKSLRYYTPEAIQEEILIDVLQEAYAVRGKGFWKPLD
ncbi:DUF1801 domain-containing protein [Aquimarina brevivitae]|uniref:YdhG-like domain-containing protein n=1 Tax=Aquimarina brevivitae TaxID=323412 RepID=A0A4Q7NX22_9FLAO|nr:DUF1801 domain-containing protein [Aquimarina brevivitae]RZS91901.1 hypothetical protein EV197_3005 [Aquimarina brevivitae]